MTMEELQSKAAGQDMDGINDVVLSRSRFRIDTGRGSSHHRMPSLSAILLNLVSLFVPWAARRCSNFRAMFVRILFGWLVLTEVLLKVPQAVTMMFANMCLGNLSKVYKRATEEASAWSTQSQQSVLLYSNSDSYYYCHVYYDYTSFLLLILALSVLVLRLVTL